MPDKENLEVKINYHNDCFLHDHIKQYGSSRSEKKLYLLKEVQ